MLSNIPSQMAWRSYGAQDTGGGHAGLSLLHGNSWLGNLGWTIATYTRDAIYMESIIISTRQWQSYGLLANGVVHGGLSTLNGIYVLNYPYFNIATYE